MSQTVHLMVSRNVGCGMPEGKCLPCSGVSGRTAAVYSCPSLTHCRIQSRVKIGALKCGSVASSFVCEARRSPDFSRQNRHGPSRGWNRNNDGRDNFENFEEDMLSSKNGPLVSRQNKHGPSRGRNRNNDGRDIFENFEEDMLSSKNGSWVSLSPSGKSQATSAPGPREKEIVELFRKVQARLRERAGIKEEEKVEAPGGHGKENSAVDSLLNLLKKHSAEQVKRSSVGDRGKNLNSDQLQESNQYDGGQTPKDESQEANISSVARPQSYFRRRSPVPRVKYQPVSNIEDDTNVVSIGSGDNENIKDQIDLKPEDEPESESDLETKDELFLPEVSEDDDSHDSEQTYNDKSVEEQLVVQNEDLSALKLSELRALAKSRGITRYSKMKKGELLELLT